MHSEFVSGVVRLVKTDPSVVGLAVGGSWIENQIDEFSDLDLVLITGEIVSDSFDKMYGYAERFGHLLNAFTGEHVGEKRLLICLYGEPLIHVDIKFVVLDEFRDRIENPVILWDREGALKQVIETTAPKKRELDYQWIEDRFWTWIHYAALKLGRGEYFEALDFVSFLRARVLAPLLQVKKGGVPRGLRKVEQTFGAEDLWALRETIPVYSAASIADALAKCIVVYRELRDTQFAGSIIVRSEAERNCVGYFREISARVTKGACRAIE